MPSIDDPIAIAEGAVFSFAGLEQLGLAAPDEDSSGFTAAAIEFQEGIDPERALTRLGLEGARPVFPTAPAEISRLDQVSGLPRVLAGLLAGLAVIAVGNALWQTVRRRRRDLAVLRAMGFDRGQVVAAMSWQAFALAVIGLVIGLPVGVVVGRWMWSLLAGALGVATDPITPPTTLVLVPVTVALAVVAGAAFGAVATRRSPSHALRAD
jgi:predicted lysophospholipase L1 biosynthesis ABC-type transport system permease subunit